MNILVIGKQASGKGTVIEELVKKNNLFHLSTGDLFREEVHKNSELGKKLQEYMHEGKLVPDRIVIDVLHEKMKQEEKADGFLFDGFPRTLEQAKILDSEIKIAKVLNLEISDDLAIHRITGRRICSNDACAKTYSVNPDGFPHPKKEGICDVCGEKLYQRDDDTEEAVKVRLNLFKEKTLPVIEYFREKDLVVDIDASKKPEEIFKELDKTFS